MAAINTRPQVSPVAFSGVLGDTVRALAPHSEADPVGILGSLLSAFSAAVGNLPNVCFGTQSQTLTVWSVLVGNTGLGRKGTATRVALDVLRTALPDWTKANILEGCPQSGPAYVSTLADMGGTALMLEEEFADLLKVSARYKNMGKALRRSWEGASVSNRTKEAVIHIDAPHVAIIGNVTPTEWGTSVGKADKAGGTLNRFLPLYVERSKRIRLSDQISATEWSQLIKPLAAVLKAAVRFARNTEEVTLSDAALSLWDDQLCEAIESLTIGREAMEQFAARGTDQAMRIAALYALADMRDEILPQDLDAAVSLVTYMAETVQFLSPDVTEAGASLPLEKRIEAFVRQAGEEGVPAGDLYRKFGMKKAEMEAVVTGLPTVEIVTGKSTGGRPPRFYRYVAETVTSEGESEVTEVETEETDTVSVLTEETEVPTLEVPSVDLLSDDDWWTETEEEKALAESLKAPIMEAPKEAVPSAVEALRARLQAPKEEIKAEVKPSGLSAVDALQALLNGATMTDMEPVKVATPKPAEKVQSVSFRKVAARTLGTKVVPPVTFQAPTFDDSDLEVMVDVAA
ncbi:DUF3987 domain-containing protein [Streptosporangium sp. NPDC087985]|uniref:DUF3987 domain-containing protein n=1 Tax=Streptosporangium sp. NPDC087985 TaxID=3366196 RepID=UPI003829F036